ncbi:hypothetical protein CesoFtcFv8_022495 [Champsocephalus esox]|uniref:Uncharacterized protein n=1 Tax=Champsocephalus esox TaxID=159716 RepID=A0AAN8BC03_9TELE|nr:hypothetical protein CesoFtcFv8_022495 [Champsocephalus esox]
MICLFSARRLDPQAVTAPHHVPLSPASSLHRHSVPSGLTLRSPDCLCNRAVGTFSGPRPSTQTNPPTPLMQQFCPETIRASAVFLLLSTAFL